MNIKQVILDGSQAFYEASGAYPKWCYLSNALLSQATRDHPLAELDPWVHPDGTQLGFWTRVSYPPDTIYFGDLGLQGD